MALVCKKCGYKQYDDDTIESSRKKYPDMEEHDIPYICGACINEEDNGVMLVAKIAACFDRLDIYEGVENEGKNAEQIVEEMFCSPEQTGLHLETIERLYCDSKWGKYIAYLIDWALSHKEPIFERMSPACYEEWCENEYAYEEEE